MPADPRNRPRPPRYRPHPIRLLPFGPAPPPVELPESVENSAKEDVLGYLGRGESIIND